MRTEFLVKNNFEQDLKFQTHHSQQIAMKPAQQIISK